MVNLVVMIVMLVVAICQYTEGILLFSFINFAIALAQIPAIVLWRWKRGK